MRARKQIDGLHCVICGSNAKVERNHVGGRNHVAWFWMPCCKKHHDHFHALLRMAGVNLEYTSDPRERLLRALKAAQVFEWMLLEALNETLHEKAEVNDDVGTA